MRRAPALDNAPPNVVYCPCSFHNYTYRDDEHGHIAQMSYDNRQAFDREILSGDAAICFLSPELFETVAKEGARFKMTMAGLLVK